ncbi:cupredoxin family protein [Variovorax rhizosphaerae]|uniref:Cupredoxin family protein n=1 Tax=Variovorax rhizosphaerae TaxID=1836200 RepID=A0ABU8WKC2_9BURK
MKKNSICSGAMLALALLASGNGFANGTHAGGHGHDADASVGKPGIASKATRTVSIDMNDTMRFIPADIHVKKNETVRFVITNSGVLKHELVLGTEKELKEHYEVMKKHPEMEHADPNMVTLAPGKSGEIVWQFTKAGKVDFACLQPGHYDAGMKGAVNVKKALTKATQ